MKIKAKKFTLQKRYLGKERFYCLCTQGYVISFYMKEVAEFTLKYLNNGKFQPKGARHESHNKYRKQPYKE